MTDAPRHPDDLLHALVRCLDAYVGRYRELRGAGDFGAYLTAPADRGDEELLTEPVLARIMEEVLGFPADAYFPQLGRSGLKPDFTPIDLIAHSFVLDAKGSDQSSLAQHEGQIRAYMGQRSLDYGILFNLREFRVFRRGQSRPDAELSFGLEPLWRLARGEAMAGPERAALARFHAAFRHRRMSGAEKVDHIRRQEAWSARFHRGESVTVDVSFLSERLRRLAGLLVDDAAAQTDRLRRQLDLSPNGDAALVRELQSLAREVQPGVDATDLPPSLDGWIGADGAAGRAWRQYLLRVAYLALTRIVLYRAWEDVEFVQDRLYDGGFRVAYDRLSGRVDEVLAEAFMYGAERYRWLFGESNNYHWYRPREDALVEVLYSLASVPLGRLDADVLGDLYQSYVDSIDRDRLGQFYTPRSVVRFMLDRAGFGGPEGVFRIEGDRREPKRVYDFATGSGGFLVEAARRIIDEGGIAADDAAGLAEALRACVRGLVGTEISPFPYYLTEINLLLQVSRLLGRMSLLGESPGSFTLGVLHTDALVARADRADSLDLPDELRGDRRELMEDDRFGLVPLDGDKREFFRALREDGGFDLVIGNPPYVAEANNRPLFERLRAIAAWKGDYRGKTDYLYYFLLMALEKVRPEGRLCVITPAGWMNAGNADFLRGRLAGELRLDELYLFGSYRLFVPDWEGRTGRRSVPTPTVESAILVATKIAARANHSLRVVELEDEVAAARALSGDPEAKAPDRELLLEMMARRGRGKPGRRDGIEVLNVRQSRLVADRPWPVKYATDDVATIAVDALDELSRDETSSVEPLSRSWHVFQGIKTGADAYTKRIDARLTEKARARLRASGCRIGEAILELPKGTEIRDPWRDHRGILARSMEPRALLYGAVDDEDYTHLVVVPEKAPPPRRRWSPPSSDGNRSWSLALTSRRATVIGLGLRSRADAIRDSWRHLR